MERSQKGKSLFANYQNLMNFIARNYYNSPIYSLGSTCYTQEEFRTYVRLWYAWYNGYVEDIHRYTVYNGKEQVKQYRNTLEMAKKLCEDKADLLMNEKVDFSLEDSSKEFLDAVLETNNFRPQSNELIEKTQALGTGAYVEFIDREKIVIDYLTTDKIIPITVINNEIINCAFASDMRQMDDKCTYLNVHIYVTPLDPNDEKYEELAEQRLEKGIPVDYEGYIVENKILKFEGGAYTEISSNNPNMLKVELTDSKIPRFQIIKPAKANNICWDNPGLGISVYSNALFQLKGVDLVYDSYLNEFDKGKTRMFVHDSLAQINIDTDGSEAVMKPIFDTNDTEFYALDMGEDSEKIKHVQPELRIEDHELGLNRQLNLLGFKCGFGNNYYKFENGVVKTATEVISENNPLFKSIKKDQHILRAAHLGMARAILSISNQYLGTNFDVEQNITVNYDDSIFEDTDKVRKDALLELNSGAIDQVEYHMRVYNLTEEQAIEKVAKMQERSPEPATVTLIGGDE